MISVRQLEAARALLGWSQQDLAAQAGVSPDEIPALESSGAETIVRALQAAGVVFLPQDGVGVRLAAAKPQPLEAEELNASNDE